MAADLKSLIAQAAQPGTPHASMQVKIRRYFDDTPDAQQHLVDQLQQGKADVLDELAKASRLTRDEREEMFEIVTRTFGSDFREEIARQRKATFQGAEGAWGGIAGAMTHADPAAHMRSLIKAMNDAWPRDFKGDFPPGFVARADELQVIKQERIKALGSKPKVSELSELITAANEMHGKAGHTQNLIRIGTKMLCDPALELEVMALRIDTKRVLDALPWLNLADLYVPVKYLSAKRRLEPAEMEKQIHPRGMISAEKFDQYRLGDTQTAKLIADHRIFDKRPRSLEAEVVDLLDQVTAMSAKPFFRLKEGDKDVGIDSAKIAGELKKTAAIGVDPRTLALMLKALELGIVDKGLKEKREEDLYVRT